MSLSHTDKNGSIKMVDVGDKEITRRQATARGKICMSEAAFDAVINNRAAKGNVLVTAKVAAIMAAKRTAETIPLCHPLPIGRIDVDFTACHDRFEIEVEATVSTKAATGVEMEALHAVSTALLTIYDMTKAMDKGMLISDIRLIHKAGGKSGEYLRQDP